MASSRQRVKRGSDRATAPFVESWVRACLAVWVILASTACIDPPLATAETTGSDPRPNIVFMMADNLGYGDVGAYGGGELRGMPTPRLDRMAQEGLMLTQFLVEPGCTPSRAAFLTARYSIRSGLSLIVLRGTGNTLADREVTIAEVLRDAGYDTAMLGKWHVGMEAQSQPQNQGFDEWYGILNSTDEVIYGPNMEEAKLPGADRLQIDIVEARAGGKLRTSGPYTPETRRTIDLDLAERAERYIAEKARTKNPFFLFVSWTRPHFPNLPSPDFDGASRIGDYGDSVMELDHNVGRVLDAVDGAGISKNTIVVFVSDNGPMRSVLLPEDGGWGGMYRGELGTPYEGSLRTPALVRWPGRVPARKSNEMVSIMDLAPTLARLAGAEMPSDRPVDGVDLSKFVLGESESSPRDHLLTFIGDHLVAMRFHQFRIYFKDFVDVGGSFAQGGTTTRMIDRIYPVIYNIEADPREERDVGVYQAGLTSSIFPYIAAYKRSLVSHPNPPAATMTDY